MLCLSAARKELVVKSIPHAWLPSQPSLRRSMSPACVSDYKASRIPWSGTCRWRRVLVRACAGMTKYWAQARTKSGWSTVGRVRGVAQGTSTRCRLWGPSIADPTLGQLLSGPQKALTFRIWPIQCVFGSGFGCGGNVRGPHTIRKLASGPRKSAL